MTDQDYERFREQLAAASRAAVWVGNADSGGFVHIIESWDELRGPETGIVTVPEGLADYQGETADLDAVAVVDGERVHHELQRLYHRVINRGSTQHQRDLLNQRLLVLNWTDRVARPEVRALWEKRFPRIRG